MDFKKLRQKYKPKLPKILSQLQSLSLQNKESISIDKEIIEKFPNTSNQPIVEFLLSDKPNSQHLKVGVLFSGGQAPGGHNVITGLFDALKSLHPSNQLFGFLSGPAGLLKEEYKELTHAIIDEYRNQGGFDMIGSGRTKIETMEQFEQAAITSKKLNLNGLVIIGGDDSNTNAAYLAEYFLKNHINISVVGVPKTIDGDLKNEYIEIPFGFDTATKTYSEIISNIARDALSAKKYYFFIKMMGRSASHVTLECALQVHPNIALISEEIANRKIGLHDLVQEISDVICQRAAHGKNYGVILIPEGLIENIPDFLKLIDELNGITDPVISSEILTKESLDCFNLLPYEIQKQLLLEKDPHGNIQVSKIETERLLISLIEKELKIRKELNQYRGQFNAQPMFIGYEGRSSFPSNFDSQYCYSLGFVATLLIKEGLTGYMSCLKNLTHSICDWLPLGIPLIAMMNMEKRKGKMTAVVKKSLVDLQGEIFKEFLTQRDFWKIEDDYNYKGPIQFYGPEELVESIPLTLR